MHCANLAPDSMFYYQTEKHEQEAASEAYDIIQARSGKHKGNDTQAVERKEEWVRRAEGSMTKIFNDRRTTVQQAMKTAFRKLVSGKEKKEEQVLPSAELVKKCVMRQIDKNKPEEWELFKWYCDELIGKWFCYISMAASGKERKQT